MWLILLIYKHRSHYYHEIILYISPGCCEDQIKFLFASTCLIFINSAHKYPDTSYLWRLLFAKVLATWTPAGSWASGLGTKETGQRITEDEKKDLLESIKEFPHIAKKLVFGKTRNQCADWITRSVHSLISAQSCLLAFGRGMDFYCLIPCKWRTSEL